MTTITTRNDLSTWIANTNPIGYQVAPNRAEVHEAIVDALQSGDHPAWGEGWDDYLDAFDYAAVVDLIAES